MPVLRITAGAGSVRASASITAVSWAGLRGRVRINATQPGLSVDLRMRVNDAESSTGDPRPVDAEGAASLLVTDDDPEGTPAAIVIMDPGGQVIARQSTIIEGEG